MAPPSSPATRVTPRKLGLAERQQIEDVLWRRDVLRRGVIVVVALSIAALVVALGRVVGTHLTAKWWIESHNGMVFWDFNEANWRQGGVTTVIFRPNSVWQPRSGNGNLAYVHKLLRVISLNLAEDDGITNKGLAQLKGLDFLAELNIARLDRYRETSFHSPVPLTDACLVHLQALPRLEKLTLSGNLITDQGLAQIAKINTLKTLDLEATEITDAGLKELAAMKSLESVNLGATRVTKAGIARLRAVRPDLTIELDVDPAVEKGVAHSREGAR